VSQKTSLDFCPCPPISRDAEFCLIAEAPIFRLGLRDAGQTPDRANASKFAATPCRGLSLSRQAEEVQRSVVNQKEALAFVERHGIVLQAARGPVPNLAEAIAGGPIRGSWWGHPKGKEIFRAAEAICESPNVLVCKLIGGKITYVHRRLWPAFIKLASRFREEQLAKVWNEHTASGAHQSKREPFPTWVSPEVMKEAKALSIAEAESILSQWLELAGSACEMRQGK